MYRVLCVRPRAAADVTEGSSRQYKPGTVLDWSCAGFVQEQRRCGSEEGYGLLQ